LLHSGSPILPIAATHEGDIEARAVGIVYALSENPEGAKKLQLVCTRCWIA